MVMIQKGYVSEVLDGGKAVRVTPHSGGMVTVKLAVPESLQGVVSVKTAVAYAAFPDNTGIVVGRMDGAENTGGGGIIAFDTFPTETELAELPNDSYFTVISEPCFLIDDQPEFGYKQTQSRTELADYYKTSTPTENALRFTVNDATFYVIPVNQAPGEMYLPYYGIKVGSENAEANSAIMDKLLSIVKNGTVFKFPSGHFYFSKPIDFGWLSISVVGCVSAAQVTTYRRGTTFLHFTSLSDGEAALKVAQCSLRDFTVWGSQYDLSYNRDNVFEHPENVVHETVGAMAYGIYAHGGRTDIHGVNVRNFYCGIYCDNSNIFVTDADFRHCHYGLSLGHDNKACNISGFYIMTLLQMRGSLASAIGVRGDSIGDHLIEILRGNNITLMDIDADFCMNSIIAIGDGTAAEKVENLEISGIHGRSGVSHIYSTSGTAITAQDITASTVAEFGVVAVKNNASLLGAIISTTQARNRSPIDGVDGYACPYVLLSAGANTTVQSVNFTISEDGSTSLSAEWAEKVVRSFSLLQNCCRLKINTCFDGLSFHKSYETVSVKVDSVFSTSDGEQIKGLIGLSNYALDATAVKSVNGIIPDESGNVEVVNVEPEVVPGIEYCVDTSKRYVLPDGYIYSYRKEFIPGGTTANFTNQLKKAVDASGNPYNGGAGYKDKTYIKSDCISEATSIYYDCTGFIPAKKGDVIRLKNATLMFTNPSSGGTQSVIALYLSDYSYSSNKYFLETTSSLSSAWSPVINDAGTDYIQFTIPNVSWFSDDISFIRLNGGDFTDESIITVNEEITYTTTEDRWEGSWQNTGELYVKPDYLAMIAELEARIVALESKN